MVSESRSISRLQYRTLPWVIIIARQAENRSIVCPVEAWCYGHSNRDYKL